MPAIGRAQDHSPAARRQASKRVAILCICACTCLYALCWEGLHIVLPLLADKVGATSTMHWGYFHSFSSTISLLGGLLTGPLKDRYGGKLLYVISFGSCCVSYFLIGQCTSLLMFYVAMLPNVIEQGWLAAQALAMDYSTEEDKVVILGRVTAAYSIGQILGPTIAGAVAALSLQLVPIGASLVCFGGLLVVMLFLEDRPSFSMVSPSKGEVARRHFSFSNSNGAPTINPPSFVQDLWTAWSQPLVASVLLMKFFARAGSSVFYAMLAKVLFDYFHQSSTVSGLLFSYMGIVGFVVQAIVVGPLSSRSKFEHIVAGSLAGLLFVALSFGFCSRIEHLFGVVLVLEFAENVFQTITVAMLTSITEQRLSGTVLGIDTAVLTVAEVIGSIVGASLLTLGGTTALGLGSAGLMLPACFIAARLKLGSAAARKDWFEVV